MGTPSKAHTLAARCLDAPGGEMVRAHTSVQMRASKEGNAGARVKYRMMRQKSTLATIRNNQAIRPSYNAIVMMQMLHLQNHKQRKRDNTNNASVISCIPQVQYAAMRIQRYAHILLCSYADMSIQQYGDILYATTVISQSTQLLYLNQRKHYIVYATTVICGYAHMVTYR